MVLPRFRTAKLHFFFHTGKLFVFFICFFSFLKKKMYLCAMKRFIQENIIFLSHCLVFLCVLGSLLCLIPQTNLHLALNGFHTHTGDIFFRYFTQIGEWVPYAIAACLLFYKVGSATFLISSNLIAGLVTQIIKRIVCAPRPAKVFDIAHNPDAFPIVEGVKLHLSNSFPSGHTTTCFAVFFAIAILIGHTRLSATGKQLAQYACFLLALVGSYSRIYLSQHFAADVFAGAIVALCVVMAIYPLFRKWEKAHPKSYNWNFLHLRKHSPA